MTGDIIKVQPAVDDKEGNENYQKTRTNTVRHILIKYVENASIHGLPNAWRAAWAGMLIFHGVMFNKFNCKYLYNF